jgi:hypothetical protein
MTLDLASTRLPELKQYQDIIMTICRQVPDAGVTELQNSFQALSVRSKRYVGFVE